MRQIACTTLFFLLAGCAGSEPSTIFTSLRAKPQPEDSGPALQRIQGWHTGAAEGSELSKALAKLLASETDRRCASYLDAGAAAWREGNRVIARQLWALALDCHPSTPRELEIDAHTRLVAYRLTDRLSGVSRVDVRDFPPKSASPTFDAPFVQLLFRELKLPDPQLSMVRHGWVLRVASPTDMAREDKALAALAEAQKGWMINVEARIYAVPRKKMPWRIAALFMLDGPVTLSDDQRRDYEAWLASSEVTPLSAPRVTSFPAQLAHIAVINQHAYIRDYALVFARGAAIADPEIGVVQEGLLLGIRALRMPDGSFLAQLAPEVAQLARPIPSVTVKLGYGVGEVQLQLPQVATLAKSFSLRQGEKTLGWLPLGVLPDAEGVSTGHAVVTTMRAVRIPEEKGGSGSGK